MKTSLVVDALRMAIANEHPSPGLIFHSDQGSQYCSHVFQEFLLHQGISGSMSERGQCWDNAPAESFWATLKRETLPLSGCLSSDNRMDPQIDIKNDPLVRVGYLLQETA